MNAMLPKSVIFGKKQGMFTGLQSDSEIKEGGGKELLTWNFPEHSQEGLCKKGLFDLKHEHRVKDSAILCFVPFCVQKPILYRSVYAQSSLKTQHPLAPPKKLGHVSLEYLISSPTSGAWRETVTHLQMSFRPQLFCPSLKIQCPQSYLILGTVSPFTCSTSACFAFIYAFIYSFSTFIN